MHRRDDLAPHPGFEKGVEFWADVLTKLFELPDPAAFPPLQQQPTAEERRIIERYMLQTRRLVASSGLNEPSGIRMSWTRGSDVEWDANLPSYEAVSGLSVTFRQIYSNDEPASFNQVMRILQRLARDASSDEEARVDALAQWGKANRTLRAKSADRLATEKVSGGDWPEDDDTPPPEKIISLYFYGEHVHWESDKAAQIAAWSTEPFIEHFYRYRFLQAVAPLAHLYIIFAVYIAHIMRASGYEIAG